MYLRAISVRNAMVLPPDCCCCCCDGIVGGEGVVVPVGVKLLIRCVFCVNDVPILVVFFMSYGFDNNLVEREVDVDDVDFGC